MREEQEKIFLNILKENKQIASDYLFDIGEIVKKEALDYLLKTYKYPASSLVFPNNFFWYIAKNNETQLNYYLDWNLFRFDINYNNCQYFDSTEEAFFKACEVYVATKGRYN